MTPSYIYQLLDVNKLVSELTVAHTLRMLTHLKGCKIRAPVHFGHHIGTRLATARHLRGYFHGHVVALGDLQVLW
jgi:hypothetical protein